MADPTEDKAPSDVAKIESEVAALRERLDRLEQAQLGNRLKNGMVSFESGLHSAWKRAETMASKASEAVAGALDVAKEAVRQGTQSLYHIAQSSWRSFQSGTMALAGQAGREELRPAPNIHRLTKLRDTGRA